MYEKNPSASRNCCLYAMSESPPLDGPECQERFRFRRQSDYTLPLTRTQEASRDERNVGYSTMRRSEERLRELFRRSVDPELFLKLCFGRGVVDGSTSTTRGFGFWHRSFPPERKKGTSFSRGSHTLEKR